MFILYNVYPPNGCGQLGGRGLALDRAAFVPNSQGGPDILTVYGPTSTPQPYPLSGLAVNVTLTANDAAGVSSFNTAGNWSSGAAPAGGSAYNTAGYRCGFRAVRPRLPAIP